jgi:hypothetical protein
MMLVGVIVGIFETDLGFSAMWAMTRLIKQFVIINTAVSAQKD